MARRKPLSLETIAKIVIQCRRRCCLCVFLNNDERVKKGQIVHINRDPNDNREINLVYLCLEHHDEYDSRSSQSKGLTSKEILFYRNSLYKRYALENLDDDILGTQPVLLGANIFSQQAHQTSPILLFPEIYELLESAIQWESSKRPYFYVERLSEELKAMVRHPPIEMNITDDTLKSFLLLAGLHYGGNWLHWTKLNLTSSQATSTITLALSVSYDRVRFRALYALQFFEQMSVSDAIDSFNANIDVDVKNVVQRYVLTQDVISYLNKIARSTDRELAGKSKAVIREIKMYKPLM